MSIFKPWKKFLENFWKAFVLAQTLIRPVQTHGLTPGDNPALSCGDECVACVAFLAWNEKKTEAKVGVRAVVYNDLNWRIVESTGVAATW